MTPIKKLYNFIGKDGRTKIQLVNFMMAERDNTLSIRTIRNYLDVLISCGVIVKYEGLFFKGI